MRAVVLAFALVMTVLGAVPVEACCPGGDWNPADGLLTFLSQLQQQIEEILAWIGGVADYSDAAYHSLAPILDRAYSAQVLARRVEALAAGDAQPVSSGSARSCGAPTRDPPAAPRLPTMGH